MIKNTGMETGNNPFSKGLEAINARRIFLEDHGFALAEAFLGANPVTDLSLLASLKRDYLAGKSVKLLAYAKKSTVSGQKEIVGKAVMGLIG